jgi:hypothetical protein
MPIVAAQGRSDARAAAWLLASGAKDCLENPATASAHVAVLNNVYRLLESYRVNAFFGFERFPTYQQPGETISLVPPLEQHVGTVRDVLDGALRTAFSDWSKDDALKLIEDVLKSLAYPGSAQTSDADKHRAKQFFAEILRQL